MSLVAALLKTSRVMSVSEILSMQARHEVCEKEHSSRLPSWLLAAALERTGFKSRCAGRKVKSRYARILVVQLLMKRRNEPAKFSVLQRSVGKMPARSLTSCLRGWRSIATRREFGPETAGRSTSV
jgi:hypothetical protein